MSFSSPPKKPSYKFHLFYFYLLYLEAQNIKYKYNTQAQYYKTHNIFNIYEHFYFKNTHSNIKYITYLIQITLYSLNYTIYKEDSL